MKQNLLEKLTVAQLVKELSTFTKPENSLQYSQNPVTDPCPEPDESNLHPHTLHLRSILIVFFHLRLGLPSGFFPLGFATIILNASLI
jgi:hypothetical protein